MLLRVVCPSGVELVGQGRLELPTSRLSGVRSNHLSYWPWRRVLHPEIEVALVPWKLNRTHLDEQAAPQ